MFNFQNLKVRQKSVSLIAKLDSLLDDLPRKEQFSLGEQMRRAGLSISCNIKVLFMKRSVYWRC